MAPKCLENLGSYQENPAFKAFHDLSNKSFELYHQHIQLADRNRPMVDLIRRMLYVSEASSASLRLTASWGLTHPAFSLCRDRFEQCTKFSWLARDRSNSSWLQYILDLYLTRHNLRETFRRRNIQTEELMDAEFSSLPKEAQVKFRAWKNTSLERIASLRDRADGITNSKIDNQKLSLLYESIYRQASSVSHFDLYSINMLSLFEVNNEFVLSADPYMPIVIVLHCSLFDLIQCAEAAARAEVRFSTEVADTLIAQWWEYVRKTGLLDKPKKSPPKPI